MVDREHTSEVGDIFYRIQDRQVSAGVDEFDHPLGPSTTQLHTYQMTVTRVTPCGVWLNNYRFVLLTALRRYAHATFEEAVVAFKARKEKQRRILNGQLSTVSEALRLVNSLPKPDTNPLQVLPN